MSTDGTPAWCEWCQDAFPVDHFEDGGGYHKAGPEYGPAGLELWKMREIRALAEGPMKGTPHGDRLLAILDTRLPDDGPADECDGTP